LNSEELRPKLRNFEPIPVQDQGQMMVALQDATGFCTGLVVLTPAAFHLASLMDGRKNVAQLCSAFEVLTGQQADPIAVGSLIESLDESLALDSARSRGVMGQMTLRKAALAGQSYPSDAQQLKFFLDDVLALSSPPSPPSERRLQALLLPHIDLKRGSQSYAAALAHLRPQLDQFDTFVILGISHSYSHQPFVLTRMDFDTPLGVVETDGGFVDQLASGLDFDAFEDEFNHIGEHSVEFQAVWLRHLIDRPIKIVPVLCGSFHRSLLPEHQTPSPKGLPGVSSFLRSLKSCLDSRQRVLVIASVDFAHMGVRFGGEALSNEFLQELHQQDAHTFSLAMHDAEGFIASLRADRGSRNYCGTPAIYTALEMLTEPQGEALHYQQCIEGENQSVVTVGAAAYYAS
jgi:MEMO1 family protein